jgi:hypothetical protein
LVFSYLVESSCVVLIVEPHVLQLEGGDGGVDEQTHLEVLPQLQLFCNTIYCTFEFANLISWKRYARDKIYERNCKKTCEIIEQKIREKRRKSASYRLFILLSSAVRKNPHIYNPAAAVLKYDL